MPGMYWLRVITNRLYLRLLALSFDFLAHYVGLVSLGGAFFVGVGGYLTAMLNTSWGLSPLFTIPAATLLGAVICTSCCCPASPCGGSTSPSSPSCIPFSSPGGSRRWTSWAAPTASWASTAFPYAWLEQYFVIVMLLLILSVCHPPAGQHRSGAGDAGSQRQRSGGQGLGHEYHPLQGPGRFHRFGHGLPGRGLPGAHLHVGGISTFALDFSILPIAATVIGGSGTLVGPVLGCLILVPISELLRDFRHPSNRVLFPDPAGLYRISQRGLMVYGQRKYQQFERWTNI
jgi:branched-chain amino acid transport system permease protein